MAELAKPGRDPREQFEAFSFTEGINTIENLSAGIVLGILLYLCLYGKQCL
jgi:uncharacterized protein